MSINLLLAFYEKPNDHKEVWKWDGAKIIDKQNLGQKELAYEIKDNKSGYYYLFTLESDDDKAIKEFDRLGLISDVMIRHLITKVEN